MAVVTVQEYGKSQSGSPKIKASGKWYFLNKKLQDPPLRSEIEITESSFKMGDKTFITIEAWQPAGGNAQTQHNGTSPSPAVPPAGDYVDEATMRFISNCVGSAISAGAIKTPGDIAQWYQAAKCAVIGQDFIPF